MDRADIDGNQVPKDPKERKIKIWVPWVVLKETNYVRENDIVERMSQSMKYRSYIVRSGECL